VKPSNSLLPLLHAYFHEWMAGQRSASRHTILSYRDTWRLFLRFVAERNHRDVAQLTLADLSDKQVLAFLDHLEKTCRRTITTRNCRLAALHSFFSFLADRDPLAAGQCAAILRIPNKRAPKRTGAYLEPEELEVLMDQPDRKTKLGERDHVLLALLYNSGARISEALQVRPIDIRLDPPTQVRLYGKGRKERICPLWPETAELLATFLKRNPAGPDEAIFRNRYGNPLGTSGVRFRLKRYIQAAAQKVPRLSEKRVSPHTLRHTAAVHLVASGVDVTIIRDWIGHVSLDTTNIYAQANLETKRQALEKADGPLRPRAAPPWKRDADLLAWLDSL
jgi:site-specific recombinase XerD